MPVDNLPNSTSPVNLRRLKNTRVVEIMSAPRFQDHLTHPLPPRTHDSPKRLGECDETLGAIHIINPVPLPRNSNNTRFHIKRPQHARHLDEQLIASNYATRTDPAAESEARLGEVLQGGCIQPTGVY